MAKPAHKHLSAAEYMAHGIEHVCKTYPNRAAGTPSEAHCQEFFAHELRPWSDEVTTEHFDVHPKAFLGWMLPAVLLILISVFAYWMSHSATGWVTSLVGVACILFVICIYFFEFGLYRQFIDGLFDRSTSYNVFATRRASKETKRRIIFGGHVDAAYEFTYLHLGGRRLTLFVLIGASIGIIFVLITSIIQLITALVIGPVPMSGIWFWIGIVDLLFVPFFIANIFFVDWRFITDGANDNLTGCYIAMAILREMSLHNARLDHTDVCCFLSGSEECGLRGALDFAQRHKQDFDDAETIFIALDTLREIDQFKIYTIGQNGFQKNCKEVGGLIKTAGKAHGQNIPLALPYLGATDAEAFSRHGIKACAFCGLDHDPQPYYHTRKDTWTNIDIDCIELCFDICMEATRLYDESNGIEDFPLTTTILRDLIKSQSR